MSTISRFIKSLIFTPEVIGAYGESSVSHKLAWVNFLGYEGRVLRNLYVPAYGGRTSEIDLVYITVKGIFVIESKNYKGYIFGGENNKNWTSTLYMGKDWLKRNKVEKYQFYNPVFQNRTHIKNLKKYLGLKKEIPIFSVIVFPGDCELKRIDVNLMDVIVCKNNELRKNICTVWKEHEDVFTEEQVDEIYNRLDPLTSCDPEIKQKHIEQIVNRQEDPNKCPRCGGQLILRTARNGKYAGNQFYGCSNYPRCTYIKNI